MLVDSCSSFRQARELREVIFDVVKMRYRDRITAVAVIRVCFRCISKVDSLLAPSW